MTVAVAAPNVQTPRVGKTILVALVMALTIQVIGTLSWVALMKRNRRVQPESPWAAATTVCGLVVMLVWLSGRGWPRRTSMSRRFHLRLWRPEPGAWSGDNLVTSVAFTLMHANHGLTYLLAVAPGFFLASVVYGYLALKSGSILPGMVLHFAGDLAFAYFAMLGGDSALLFAR